MDVPTRNLARYVKEKGINLSHLSRNVGIPYMALYDSLSNEGRSRDLRAGEACKICSFLNLDPLEINREDFFHDFKARSNKSFEGGDASGQYYSRDHQTTK